VSSTPTPALRAAPGANLPLDRPAEAHERTRAIARYLSTPARASTVGLLGGGPSATQGAASAEVSGVDKAVPLEATGVPGATKILCTPDIGARAMGAHERAV
jgi:hypothetical protein